MTLTHIPGIGEKMSDKILAQVDMQTIFKQLQQCNFREVSSIDVDGKVLGRIIRYYMSSKYGFDYQSCMQSPGITKIFNSILASVRKHIVLKRNQLQLAAWHPTCDVSEIRRRQQYIEGCKQFAGRYDAEQKSKCVRYYASQTLRRLRRSMFWCYAMRMMCTSDCVRSVRLGCKLYSC